MDTAEITQGIGGDHQEMNQGRFRRYRNEPEEWTKKDEEEWERLLNSFEEDVPDDNSRERPETRHIQVNENGAHRRLARLRNEYQRKHGMGSEIPTGMVIKNKKITFIDNYRTMSHKFYTAIKKSFLTGVEVQLILEIYDRSYGFHEESTTFLSISEIARAIDASRNGVRNALKNLEKRLVVYPVKRKKVYGNELCSYKVNLHFEYWQDNKPAFYSWVEKERKRWNERQAKVSKSYKERKKKQSS